ncbi:Amino acid ABC transporter permease [Hyphomicrobiales bacterium]|nr:Amino acid ABC transporter permease [Hyphomicrobiales bacterium]CAH1690856.1 Amino acid ABC transporter permease [Hyphomicrobiales bacterium]
MLDLNFIARTAPLFAEGLRITLLLSVLGILGSLIGGGFVVAASRSRVVALRGIARAYIEVMRNTPVIIQMFLIYFGLASLGIRFPAFICALLAIVLQNSAYMGEIYRVGIDSISRRQFESALALGMLPRTALITMVLPQAIRRILPPIGNQFVAIIKDTSIASTITVFELTHTAKLMLERTAAPYEIYAMLSILYLFLTCVTLAALKAVETAFPVRN